MVINNLDLQVVKCARPLPTNAKLDNIGFTNHGAITIVAPKNIRVAVLQPVLSPSTFEHLCGRITSRGASCVMLLVYRSRSQAVSPQFFTERIKILEHLSTLALSVVLTGDVNFYLDRPDDASCQPFIELLMSFDLLQHIDQPTHDFGDVTTCECYSAKEYNFDRFQILLIDSVLES